MLQTERTKGETIEGEAAFEVSVALYADGPARLAHALSGLTTEEIETIPDSSGPSIRQIVHALADSDAFFSLCNRVALTMPEAVVPRE